MSNFFGGRAEEVWQLYSLFSPGIGFSSGERVRRKAGRREFVALEIGWTMEGGRKRSGKKCSGRGSEIKFSRIARMQEYPRARVALESINETFKVEWSGVCRTIKIEGIIAFDDECFNF